MCSKLILRPHDPGVTYRMQPWDDSQIDRNWVEDPFDKYLPERKGFIHDCLLFYRNTEVTTLFTVWSTLFALSTGIKRQAWLDWFPSRKYFNLYVLLVAPPSICKKGAAVDHANILMSNVHKVFEADGAIHDPAMAVIKELELVEGQATPEALMTALSTKIGGKSSRAPVRLVDADGTEVRYQYKSEAGLIYPEFASSIGKQRYLEGLIELLTDLYDPRPKDRPYTRRLQSGIVELTENYVTLLAATTPVAFKDSIPSTAHGDGFLSRCVIAYQDSNPRIFPMAKNTPGAPTIDDLRERYAWILANSLGEWKLSKEAYAMYENWYHTYRAHLEDDPNRTAKVRTDQQVLTLSGLIKAHRYDAGTIINEEDMGDAIKLVNNTNKLLGGVIDEIKGDKRSSTRYKVIKYIQDRGRAKRVQIMRGLNLPRDILDPIIRELVDRYEVWVYYGGKRKHHPSFRPHEEYVVRNLDDEGFKNACEEEAD